MARGADVSTEESDVSSSSHPTPRTVDGSKDSLDRPADSARSVGGANGKEVLVLPKQAMPAALGPRQTSEADTGDGDVPMPWWYTPRRLLVSNLSPHQLYNHLKGNLPCNPLVTRFLGNPVVPATCKGGLHRERVPCSYPGGTHQCNALQNASQCLESCRLESSSSASKL